MERDKENSGAARKITGNDHLDKDDPAFPIGDQSLHPLCCGFTAGQYAAIHLSVPDSGCGWLDDMIRVKVRRDAAERVIQGLLSREDGFIEGAAVKNALDAPTLVAAMCVLSADALLAELADGEGE